MHVTVPDLPVAWQQRLAALDAFEAVCTELTEEQWRLFDEAVQRRPWFGNRSLDLLNGYLLDTNIVTARLKKNPVVRQHLRDAEATGRPVRLNAVKATTKRAVGSCLLGRKNNCAPLNNCGGHLALS